MEDDATKNSFLDFEEPPVYQVSYLGGQNGNPRQEQSLYLSSEIFPRATLRAMKTVIMASFLFLVFCSAKAQQVTDENKALVNKLVSYILGWEKLSTAGAKAELHEASRGEQHGKLKVSYNLVVTGVPRDTTYSLVQWPINESEPKPSQLSLSIVSDGNVVVCTDVSAPDHCGESATPQFSFYPAKGEPFRIALISVDGKHKAMALVVPDPIVNVDQGCSVESVRLTARFEAALIRGKGFKPSEEISIQSKSEGEMRNWTSQTDADGQFTTVVLPFVKGKRGGKDQILARGSNCAPAVSFEWGVEK